MVQELHTLQVWQLRVLVAQASARIYRINDEDDYRVHFFRDLVAEAERVITVKLAQDNSEPAH